MPNVGSASKTPPEDAQNFENFQRSQSFRTLENILHTFFANSLLIVWRLENFFVSLCKQKGGKGCPPSSDPQRDKKDMKSTIETKQVTKADGTILTYQRKRCGAKVSRWALVHSTACGY